MLSSTMYLKYHNIEQIKINTKQCYINKYFPGQYMGPHADSYGNKYDKKYTMLIYLNSNYDGGEIIFNNKNIKFKPKAGSMLIFPAEEIHSTNIVENGNKYFILLQF
jgi:Rps23 Pro-64 3,4-dihydroxylase Tpa1-like proline 4-hydroxylase